MASSKYVGYVGGVAVAVGVGAAIAAASQGTANADIAKPDSPGRSDSALNVDAGPKKSEARAGTDRPKPLSRLGDNAEQVTARVSKVASDIKNQVDTEVEKVAAEAAKAVSRIPAPTLPAAKKQPAAEFEAAQVEKLQGLFGGEGAAATTDTAPAAATTPDVTAAADSVPWSPNPFRPLPPEPAPNDMPGAVWSLEKAVVGAFPDFVQPVPREGFEAGYRISQMIPWVNVVVPLSNIARDLPDALGGDKDATQRIVNNLIVTIQPVAIAYYGYNGIADLINLEQPALDLQNWAISTAWSILDPFALLHNRGESGLPLSTTTPPPYPPAETVSDQAIALAAAPIETAATQSSDPNPFRADDPWPTGMPDVLLATEKAFIAAIPAPLDPLAPLFREAYEAVYRGTQIVPWVNVVIPISKILPGLVQVAQGDKTGAQVTINQLLVTTGPVSLLYYGYDEIADLLNMEDTGYELKQDVYAAAWDFLDPVGLLHEPGNPGI